MYESGATKVMVGALPARHRWLAFLRFIILACLLLQVEYGTGVMPTSTFEPAPLVRECLSVNVLLSDADVLDDGALVLVGTKVDPTDSDRGDARVLLYNRFGRRAAETSLGGSVVGVGPVLVANATANRRFAVVCVRPKTVGGDTYSTEDVGVSVEFSYLSPMGTIDSCSSIFSIANTRALDVIVDSLSAVYLVTSDVVHAEDIMDASSPPEKAMTAYLGQGFRVSKVDPRRGVLWEKVFAGRYKSVATREDGTLLCLWARYRGHRLGPDGRLAQYVTTIAPDGLVVAEEGSFDSANTTYGGIAAFGPRGFVLGGESYADRHEMRATISCYLANRLLWSNAQAWGRGPIAVAYGNDGRFLAMGYYDSDFGSPIVGSHIGRGGKLDLVVWTYDVHGDLLHATVLGTSQSDFGLFMRRRGSLVFVAAQLGEVDPVFAYRGGHEEAPIVSIIGRQSSFLAVLEYPHIRD